MHKVTFATMAIGAALMVGGCVAEGEDESNEALDEEVGAVAEEIQSGAPATSFQVARSVWFGSCTGTIIGPRHILTSAHCMVAPNDTPRFYVAWDTGGVTRVVQSVTIRPGVNPAANDYTDSNGKFADLAVVRLVTDIPSTSTPSTMAWIYPDGGDDTGQKVGAGEHDGDVTMAGTLLRISDMTYSDNDGDGHFLTENAQIDPGDDGGAFFYQNRLLGNLYGTVFEWEWRNKYTSVPFHLNWILTTMGYVWPGDAELTGVRALGTAITTFSGSTRRVCQYACEKTGGCAGYNYSATTTQCQLMSTIAGFTVSTGWSSALR